MAYTLCWRFVVYFSRHYSLIFTAYFPSAVRLGRQALLQVLVVAVAGATCKCA